MERDTVEFSATTGPGYDLVIHATVNAVLAPLVGKAAATLSPSADFPGAPVIRSTLLRRFRAGRRRASPVA